jgi:hypothetical protein
MNETHDMVEGACLCGAVTVVVRGMPGEMSACHCRMCQRWSGGIQMGIAVDAGDVTLAGPVQAFRSSEMSERLWCGTCGSAIGFRNVNGGDAGTVELVPGLFGNAAGARLTREVYADCCPEGYALAGDHDRLSKADYEAANAFVEEV